MFLSLLALVGLYLVLGFLAICLTLWSDGDIWPSTWNKYPYPIGARIFVGVMLPWLALVAILTDAPYFSNEWREFWAVILNKPDKG